MSDHTPESCDLNYKPISCDLNDHLAKILSQKKECCLTYIDEEGQFAHVRGQIIGLYALDGADWCQVSDGSKIRLDRIEEIAQN
ncbi:hypothetical protein Xen7305DRAFT_00005660 [Xenococcus sp. PCC 7305]|uniref:hypothetical protein n=1 Tax=Xenococcus sp. PCC 7305 TaxID=102125 RepID=UPI0002AC940B|nr:hypothetical protein [Xenococcus sp. PCC 7305]ELS00865.1 hypothetical protein Xen7305DRAFT_00005660 [Xenococcus sp. PCC 7305]